MDCYVDAQFDSEPLQQVLAELPRPDDLNVELRITAEGLRKAVHKMLRKARRRRLGG